MKPRNSLAYLLAVLTSVSLFATAAPATTIEIMQTFDVPGEGTSTMPQKISDQTDLVGTTSAFGKLKAFVYKVRKRRFSLPIAAPWDTGKTTEGRGINNKRHVCGDYLNGTDGTFHGFLLVSGDMNELIFSQIDVSDCLQTIPLGINNFGDFVGTAILSDGTQPAFVSLRDAVTTFAVPEATATFAYQLNSADEIIGYYTDANGIAHGYMRDAAGNLTYPIDVPGATETFLFGNNDSNWAVGRYTDASGVTHGLFYITPDDILTYDYPGATYTSLNGINKDGLICGHYGDAAGLNHGFVAQVNLTATGKPNQNTNVPAAQVKPPYSLPGPLGFRQPAL